VREACDQIPVLTRTFQVNGTAVPSTSLPVYCGIAAYSGLPVVIQAKSEQVFGRSVSTLRDA
jgi:hypothetical protein